MQKLKEFQDILVEKGLDGNVYFEVRDVLDIYIWGTYDFLQIPATQWESVTCNIIDDILKKEINMTTFMGELRRKLNMVIRSFLIKKIEKQEPLVFDNLIIKIRNKKLNNETIIINFLREFELLNINFDEKTYAFLIRKSYEFRRIVAFLNPKDYSYESFLISFNKVANKEENKEKTTTYALKKASKEIELRKFPIKAKGLYERFSDCKYVSDLEKRLIVDYFIGLLPPEKQEYVNLCCKGLLYEEDSRIANLIIGSVKTHYQRFLNSGYLPTENETLRQLYESILRRRNSGFFDEYIEDTEDYFRLLDLNLTIKRKIFLKHQFRFLEFQFRENGHSKKDFYDSVVEIIEMMKSYPISNEDEYVKILIEMVYSEIKTEIKRA